MHHRMLIILALFGLIASARAREAPAADGDLVAAAQYRYGVQLFEKGDYAGALREFSGAYARVPRFQVLYNIALAESKLAHFQRAMVAYRRYIETGGAAVPAERRAIVERQLAELAPRLGSLTVHVEGAPAAILVDDVEVGTSPLREAVAVDPGPHRLMARRAGEESPLQLVDVGSGARVDVSLTLRRTAAVPEVSPTPTAEVRQASNPPLAAPNPAPKRMPSIVPWYRDAPAISLAVLGVVALGAGTGVMVDGALGQSAAHRGPDLGLDVALYRHASNEVVAASVVLGVGVALEAAGLIHWGTRRRMARR